MTWLLLIVTHATDAVAFYVLGRSIGRRLKEGHMNKHDHDTPEQTAARRLDWTKWVAIGVLMIALAVQGLLDQHQRQQQTDCIAAYLNGSGSLSQDYQDSLQRVLDDVLNGHAGGPNATPHEVTLFYRHLADEHLAYQALTDFREAHLPKDACS